MAGASAWIGKAISYALHFPEKLSEIYIEEINVAENFRCIGVATALMKDLGAEV